MKKTIDWEIEQRRETQKVNATLARTTVQRILGCEHATTSREVRQGSTLRHVPSKFDNKRKERTSDTHVHREGDLHMG